MKVENLRDGMRRVDIEATILSITEPREVQSRYSGQTFKVADATIGDESGTVKLVLWNEQIEQVKVNDKIRVENGYIKSFRGEIQLNVGKYGTLTIL